VGVLKAAPRLLASPGITALLHDPVGSSSAVAASIAARAACGSSCGGASSVGSASCTPGWGAASSAAASMAAAVAAAAAAAAAASAPVHLSQAQPLPAHAHAPAHPQQHLPDRMNHVVPVARGVWQPSATCSSSQTDGNANLVLMLVGNARLAELRRGMDQQARVGRHCCNCACVSPSARGRGHHADRVRPPYGMLNPEWQCAPCTHTLTCPHCPPPHTLPLHKKDNAQLPGSQCSG
jgi:hypothetical protein